MRKLLVLTLTFFVFLPNNSFSQDRIISESTEIRKDIAVLIEGQSATNKRIDDLEKSLNRRTDDLEKGLSRRIDDLGQRIDDLKDIMLTGFGILFSGMFILIGFILWDRRTTLAPAVKQIEELRQRENVVDKVLEVLKSYARKEPRFKEAMQTAGLL